MEDLLFSLRVGKGVTDSQHLNTSPPLHLSNWRAAISVTLLREDRLGKRTKPEMLDNEDHVLLCPFFSYSKEYSLELVLLLHNLMSMLIPGCYVTLACQPYLLALSPLLPPLAILFVA